MNHLFKRISAFLLCLLVCAGAFPVTAKAAPDWPSNVSIQAESGIVIDADTGTVLWGQNIHGEYFPASITKVMTALIVIENCSLDETVTFSHNAVFNVESGSTNAGINEGDKLSVKDCLYALLLKSANESANALAEHVAGSTEEFANMMNARAKELGCQNTHFANPSGLNDPEHYTSAYDMALISQAAFQNPVFVEIDSTTYYKMPPNSVNPEGLNIYPGHKMLKKSSPYYYPGILGGKTGYTMIAGNTLVTCAEKDGMKLIAVILKGTTPQYWTDTKNMLDFGFTNFVSVKAADYETSFTTMTSDLSFGGLPIDKPDALVLDPDSRVTLPKTAAFSDAEAALSYDISPDDPDNAVAKIWYTYNDRKIGCTYLEVNHALAETTAAVGDGTVGGGTVGDGTSGSDAPAGDGSTGTAAGKNISDPTSPSETTEDYREKALRPFEIPTAAWMVLLGVAALIVLGIGVAAFLYFRGNRTDNSYEARHAQRLKRLEESGISADEFNALLEQRRSSYQAKKRGRKRRR